MLWGGSRSTKPCVFPCQVAGGDDERYLVCATVAAAVVPDAIGSSYVFCKNLCFCVRSSMRFLQLRLQIPLEWVHDVAWAMFWGGSRSTKPRVFPCKVAGGDDERYVVCATVAAAVVPDAIGSSYVFCKNSCFCVRSSMRFLQLWLQIAMLHGLCFGEEAGAQNLVFFRVKWLQATMKGTSCVRRLRLRSFRTRLVPPMCFARILAPVCVVLCVSCSSGCRSHWNGCMNVAWAMLWGGSRSTKPCVFPCKVAGGDDERYLVCAAVAAAVVPDAIGSSYGFCKNLCSCVRSSMRFLKLWLQIALEWLHECCMGYVVGRKPEHETLCFSVSGGWRRR